jgi:hypothetical protein
MSIYWENIYNEYHKETRRNYGKQAVLQGNEMQGKVDTFL